MLVPGLSTERKIIIQKKLDKLLNKEYNSPCNKFVKNINKFNDQITKNFLSEKMSKLNAKLSKNLYLKRYPQNRLKLLMNIDTNVSEFEHVKRIIYQTFTISELLILFNNLDYFIKNEKIRAIFPKLNKKSSDDIYTKGITEKTPLKKVKKKLDLVSPLKYDKDLNKINSSFFINKEKINKILSDYNKKVKIEKQNIINKELKNFQQKKYFQKTLNKMEFNINNISNVSNSKEFSCEHPLVNYFMDKKRNNTKANIINYKKNVNSILGRKNRYKNMLNKNKNNLNLIKNIEENFISNRMKEKEEMHKRLKEVISLTKRINNNFKKKLYYFRKNGSDNSSNYFTNLDNGTNFNSINIG